MPERKIPRERAEAKKKAAEPSLVTILDSIIAFAGVVTPDGILIEANRPALEIASLRPEDVIGKRFEETYWWSYSPESKAELRKALERGARGETSRYEAHVRIGQNRFILVDFSLVPVFNAAGKVSHMIPSGIDISDRDHTYTELRDSRTQLASIIDSAMDAIITLDANHRIVIFNSAAEKMFDCPADEAIGGSVDKFIPGRFRDTHREHIESFGRTHTTKRSMGSLGEIFGLRSDGEEFPIEASISQVDIGSRKLFTVIIRDSTERKRREEQLREQADLLDHAQDAIVVRDLDNRIRYWNKGAERMYGRSAEEAIGQSIHLLYDEAELEQFELARKILMEKGEWTGELRHRNAEGREVVVHSSWTLVRDETGNPNSVFVISTDITEQKRLETQFLRAQRLESIGTLAGGIAHDLNNVLSPIMMGLQILQLKIKDPEDLRMVEVLRLNAERGGDMVKQVLSFAKGVEGQRIALQLKHLVKEVAKILADTIPKSVSIDIALPEELWMVAGDATQLHQVLMNLCVNARDAMPQGGSLVITSENLLIDENYVRMNLEARPGRFVSIKVADTGVGIPRHIVHKIFDPFFTTKEHGKGTGLGLSTVAAIVKSHGGFINVYSEIGIGTQFKVFIPALETTEDHQKDRAVKLPVGHGELVLVVDDEASIREITKATLESFGYRVMTASDGTEAIALYAQNKDEIRVVLTDMMMPYMDGPATIRALKRLDPTVNIIASSGLTDSGKNVELGETGISAFLLKPYTADKLLNTLATVVRGEAV